MALHKFTRMRFLSQKKAYQPEVAHAIADRLRGRLKLQPIPNGSEMDGHHIIDGPGWHVKFG